MTMSTAGLQCLSTALCGTLPEPIHPCDLLPPTDPDPQKFPSIYNSIQDFKLTKPTWSEYTERCLGLTTAPSTVGGSKDIDWVIPVAIVISLLLVVAVIFIIYKLCHHAKSSAKTDNNGHLSYHDIYQVDGEDQTGKGDNSEKIPLEVIVDNHEKISIDQKNSNSVPHREEGCTNTCGHDETSDSGIASVDLHVPQTFISTKSEEQLVNQNELCPDSDGESAMAVENVSFRKNNEMAELQTQHVTNHNDCADVQNGSQQSPTFNQKEVSSSSSAEVWDGEIESTDEADKDQGQSKSNNVIPLITERHTDIKSNGSSNSPNPTDPKPKVNNMDSPGTCNCEEDSPVTCNGKDSTDIRGSITLEHPNGHCNGLENGDQLPVGDTLSKTQEIESDTMSDHDSSRHLFLCNGASPPGEENGIQSADVIEGLTNSGSDDDSVNIRVSNGHYGSNRTSSSNQSRQSDLRSDLESLINSL
ncbi:clumping factor A-like isoform X11 [Argopecten irradians]|uniref:clumping factor A-like isoform X11 n=1 Tax=Argopecten irradians TaxID=31199 RepID=UPI0037228178